MTPPNMAAITASLQSFSLNHHTTTTTTVAAGEECTNTHCHRSTNSYDAALDLNSNITLPYHWEQCLDLKTGEVYYINWRTGMKSSEHPRTYHYGFNNYIYSDYEDEGEEDEDEDEESLYSDSETSSVESSPGASSSNKHKENDEGNGDEGESRVGGHVLVVAGCKGCFMYFMVPKPVGDCPKCCGQLLHFDRSDN